MKDVRSAMGGRALGSYISNPFHGKKKAAEDAPNSLSVSYLQKAPYQLRSNQRWYKDDLSRAKHQTLRLLYLEPGQAHEDIFGRLVCVRVDQKARYDALSYSWGEQDEWMEITLDGTSGFAVTQTLWCALRRLRSTAVARPIWIDAICIDQNNTHERNQQVRMMDSTFGNARSVLIWLGDCEDNFLANQGQRSLTDDILSKVERDTHDVAKAWWNRLWVVQEVALAKELMVYFGPHVLTWSDFFMSSESRQSFKGVANLRTARAFVQTHGFARQDEVSLEELLALTANCYASDPLDYVFGIIGLVPRQNEPSTLNHGVHLYRLSPDYTLTPYELLTRLNKYLEFASFHLVGTTMVAQMLSWTATIGHLQLAKLLLDSHQVDLATEGPLALCNAAKHGRIEMLRMPLVDFMMDADSRDRDGRTPLSWAAEAAQAEAAHLLIAAYYANPSAKDSVGRTPLSWAVANEAKNYRETDRIVETMKIFLNMLQVDPDVEDHKGRTPLAWAVHAGNKRVVQLLLETG